MEYVDDIKTRDAVRFPIIHQGDPFVRIGDCFSPIDTMTHLVHLIVQVFRGSRDSGIPPHHYDRSQSKSQSTLLHVYCPFEDKTNSGRRNVRTFSLVQCFL